MLAIWMLFLCGLAMGGMLLYSIYLGLGSLLWPTTNGKVLRSEIQIRQNRASSSEIRYYHPTVVFEYVINGKRIVSKRLGNYVASGEKLREAESIVARFPQGSDIRVYYHPQFSGVAALMPGMKQPLVHGVIGFIAVLFTGSAGTAIFAENPFAFINFFVHLFGGST